MSAGMTRKEFLRRTVREGLRLVSVFVGLAGEPAPEARAGFEADFSDDELRREAAKLGLDPARATREEILRSIQRAMQAQRPPTDSPEQHQGPGGASP